MLGGTFDPVHVGHLVAATDARWALHLDLVLLVVAGDPWQKRGQVAASPADRLALARAAVDYYADNRDEIDEWVSRNRILAEEAEAVASRRRRVSSG